MLLTMALVAYSCAIGVLGPRLMRACYGRTDSPRVELATWLLLVASWTVSVVSVGLSVIASSSNGHGLAGLIHACKYAVMNLIVIHDWRQAPQTIALLAVIAFLVRIATVGLGYRWRVHHDRAKRQRTVRLLAGPSHVGGYDLFTVPSSRVAAYCLPGRPAAIVLTRGAEKQLSEAERTAVIAHEIAHLNGRHHLYLGLASTMTFAFPFVPLLNHASNEIARLVERIADDRAGQRHGRRTVAEAIATMAISGSTASLAPTGTLRATGTDVPARVKRLLRPIHRTPALRHRRILAALIVPALAVGVAVATIAPSATADPPPACMSPADADASHK